MLPQYWQAAPVASFHRSFPSTRQRSLIVPDIQSRPKEKILSSKDETPAQSSQRGKATSKSTREAREKHEVSPPSAHRSH
jgi:hypothetical protein